MPGSLPTAGAGWADAVRAAADSGDEAPAATDWYRIGTACLGMRSEDGRLRARFRTLFEECACAPPDDRAAEPVTRCTVRTVPRGVRVVRFEEPEPLDAARFALDVFRDRGYTAAGLATGWTMLRREGEEIAVSDDRLVARGRRWRSFAGSFAVHRALRLQRDVLFFHAAAVAWRGRALLVLGAKGSGKTTVALGLAARGCSFLGDELVGVASDLSVVPVRRAVSIRAGPRAAPVDAALLRSPLAAERFPDGEPRLRASVGRLLPDATPVPAKLAAAVLLTGFAPRARLERFTPAASHLDVLAPLPSSLWDSPAGLRALRTLSLFARVDCRALVQGPVAETHDRLLHLLEDACRSPFETKQTSSAHSGTSPSR